MLIFVANDFMVKMVLNYDTTKVDSSNSLHRE